MISNGNISVNKDIESSVGEIWSKIGQFQDNLLQEIR